MARDVLKEIRELTTPAVPSVPRISPDDGFVKPEKPDLSREPLPDNGAVRISEMTVVGDPIYTNPRPNGTVK